MARPPLSGACFPLCKDRYYRFIVPNEYDNDLSLFYGPRRSFCKGFVFDDGDITIEFKHDGSGILPILHHPGSYIGALTSENTCITRIFVRPTEDALFCTPSQLAATVENIARQTGVDISETHVGYFHGTDWFKSASIYEESNIQDYNVAS